MPHRSVMKINETVLGETFVALYAHTRKEERLKSNELSFNF